MQEFQEGGDREREGNRNTLGGRGKFERQRDPFDQRPEGGRRPIGDVVFFTEMLLGCFGGAEQGIDDVVDVGKVDDILPVPNDR